MGVNSSIITMMGSRDAQQYISDAAILRIINPPLQEKMRDQFTQNENKRLPKMQAWRYENTAPAGVPLDNHRHSVTANIFKMNTANISKTLTHYNISIFRYKRGEDQIEEEDMCKKEDKILTSFVEQFLNENENYIVDENNEKIGLVYDGL
jgi:hypothetical protein